MGTLGKHLESLDGLKMTRMLETEDGQKYHVVRRTNWLASVVVDGAEDLDVTLEVTDGGGVEVIEKSVIDTVLGWVGTAIKVGKKLLSGQCYTKNHVKITFGPNGNITSYENTTEIVCAPD